LTQISWERGEAEGEEEEKEEEKEEIINDA
jgi:hypothetical protein